MNNLIYAIEFFVGMITGALIMEYGIRTGKKMK